jgi:hypothetical protein
MRSSSEMALYIGHGRLKASPIVETVLRIQVRKWERTAGYAE